MFKKITENMYVKKFLELWQIPRYRALLKLGLYIIFFAFVSLYLRGLSTSSTKINTSNSKVDAWEEYVAMDNYRYTVSIVNDDTIKLVGNVNGNKQLIEYNDAIYYYNGTNLYIRQEDKYVLFNDSVFLFDVWRFSPKFIEKLIDNGKLDSKTEYADGKISKVYEIDANDFMTAYNGQITNYNDTIQIIIYEEDNTISEVEIDLTNIYKQQTKVDSDYKVNISYFLVNGIGPISVEVEG